MSKVLSKLIKNLQNKKAKLGSGEMLKVSAVIGKASLVYEKVRNAVDYQEEHLVRKNGIFRILKRKLLYEKVIMENYLLDNYHQENLAKHLLKEIIRGGYIKSQVPLEMVDEVDEIIQKYNSLLTRIKEIDGRVDKKTYRYFLEMAAVEIEAALIPPSKEKALVTAMFSVYNPRIQLKDNGVDEKEKELQVYIACYRALFKWDAAMMRTMLLNLYYPNWKNADEKVIQTIANNIDKVKMELEKQLHHPWVKPFNKILQKKAIIFWIIRDVIESNHGKTDQLMADRETLEAEVKKAINKRYKGVNVKLRRGVVRSIIYVFFTKMILALSLELPMDFYLAGAIDYTAGAINVFFPPVLMFFVAIMIRMPKKENTKKIITEIDQIVFDEGKGKTYELKHPRRRGKVTNFMFHFIYSLSFVFSLMVIFWGLNKLEFNFFSSLIFVLFLTLVSFFGIRIRRPVKELLVVDRRDNLLTALIDFFALPFVSMGRWMSGKFSKINVLAMFLDVIIDAPFKLLMEVFEGLFGFFREKKDEVMDE
ncbi:hypothetical protein HN858_01380 [Candidatus Falkowbacteria bacterium]|jgi:hypothetical protein|nr:hypothetical protein [Candidatus Falkowbacteria bacterium]MBT6573438.1 hypothetical protein [Candidatus Falkowbacteria bacterium]MBT7348305.1 hypothetical protein [Candidatus Falkowbacteria bacterium]MBT7501177.1 hypothetical protein [Candidatus Falkowbacteria bacterium]